MNTRVFRALHEIAVAVGGVLEPVELARLVAERACELLRADVATVSLLDASTNLLHPVTSPETSTSEAEGPLAPGVGAAGQAVLLGRPVLVDNLKTWPHASRRLAEGGLRSAMAVPLIVNDVRSGAVVVHTVTRRHWTDSDVQTLTLLAAQIAPAFEAARVHERSRVARQQAEVAVGLRDEALAGVSHDLSAPLSRIRLYAELIQGESLNVQPRATAEQLGNWSERIIAATLSMKSLMQELMDVARLPVGHVLALNVRQMDLLTLVRRIVEEQQAAGRLVNLRSTEAEIVGWWDEQRLMRVFGNILDNALNYSSPSTAVEVSVQAMNEPHAAGLALVEVRDRGRGIPPHDLPRVFDRFFRGSNVRSESSGSGLGLAVARQIVEQHGGTIDIQSELGRGTVVSMRLPRYAGADPSAQ